jgi:hypothetical protein
MKSIYRAARKPVTLEHSLVLTGMFRFKPASQFVERYHSVMQSSFRTYLLHSVSSKEICNYFSVHFTNKLTDFWVTLYFRKIKKDYYWVCLINDKEQNPPCEAISRSVDQDILRISWKNTDQLLDFTVNPIWA